MTFIGFKVPTTRLRACKYLMWEVCISALQRGVEIDEFMMQSILGRKTSLRAQVTSRKGGKSV